VHPRPERWSPKIHRKPPEEFSVDTYGYDLTIRWRTFD
jgi:hypothetical protein